MNKQLLALVENSRTYTLDVASKMPESSYSFKPADAGWNFLELLNHIAYGIHWWKQNYIELKKTAWEPPQPKTKKKEIVEELSDAYDALKKTIGGLKPDDERVHGFYATLDHITHHRGQAVVYLRCKGITPPDYQY